MKRIVAAVLTIVMAFSLLSASLYLCADELTSNVDSIVENDMDLTFAQSDGISSDSESALPEVVPELSGDIQNSESFDNGIGMYPDGDADTGNSNMTSGNSSGSPFEEEFPSGDGTAMLPENDIPIGDGSSDDAWNMPFDGSVIAGEGGEYSNDGNYSEDLDNAKITFWVMINNTWVEYNEHMEYPDGAPFKVTINWEFGDDEQIPDMKIRVGDLKLPDRYYSPQEFNDSGNNNAVAGQYYVKDGWLYIDFDQTFADPSHGEQRLQRKVEVNIEGALDLNEGNMPDGEDHDFEIANKTVTVKPSYKESSLTAKKEMGSVTVDENGNYVSHVKLTFTADGFIDNFRFSDTFTGEGMRLKGALSDQNWKISPERNDGSFNLQFTYVDEGKGFSAQSTGRLRAGDVVTVEYDVILPAELVKTVVMEGKIINEVYADYTNNKKEEDEDKGEAKPSFGNRAITKSGTWYEENGKNYIDWLITYNVGVDITEILKQPDWKEKLEELKIEPYVHDTLPVGLDPVFPLPEGFVWHEDTRTLDIPLTAFTAPNIYYAEQIMYTLKTVVQEGYEDETFVNNVYTDEFDEPMRGSGTGKKETVGDNGNIKKEPNGKLVRNSDGTYSLKWDITVTIPEGEFSEYYFQDEPQHYTSADGQYNSKPWVDSIELTGSSPINMSDIWSDSIDYSQINNGTVKIYGTQHNNPKGNIPGGTTLTFTVTTKVYLTGDNSYYNGDVTLKNKVTGSFGETEATYDTTLHYSSSFSKNVIEDGSDIDVKWEIKLSKPAITFSGDTYGGLIFDQDGLQIDITDIPQGMKLLKDSLEVYINVNVHKPNYPNYDEFEARLYDLILKHLSLSSDEYGRIVIRSTDGLELQRELTELFDSFEFSTAWGAVQKAKEVFQGQEIYLAIRYKTRVINIDDVLNNPNGVQYVNKASGDVNGEHGESIAQGTVKIPDDKQVHGILTKDYTYSRNPGDYPADESGDYFVTNPDGKSVNVYYRIDINENGYLLNNGQSITVVDTMGKSLDIILKSIKVMDGNGNLLIEGEDYEFSIDDKPGAETILEFKIPDGEHIVITYWASINALDDAGTMEDASNNVSLWGKNNNGFNDKTEQPSEYIKIDVAASSTSLTLDVFKYTTVNGKKIGLKGAEFVLIPGAFEDWAGSYDKNAQFKYGYFVDNGNGTRSFVEQDESEVQSLTGTLSANGTITTFAVTSDSATANPDTLYKLVERTAPDGYKPSDKPIYIYFTTYDPTNPRHEFLKNNRPDVIFVERYYEVGVENQPAASKAIPKLTKILENSNLKAGDFTFELTVEGPDGGWEVTKTIAKNNADGTVSFGNITFTKEGTYTVTITEKDDGKSGITYDSHSVVITYDVRYTGSIENGDYKLTVREISRTGDTTFVNTYSDAPTGTLSIQKIVTGLIINSDEVFAMKVTFTNEDGSPLTGEYNYTIVDENAQEGDETKTETAQLLDDGSYIFHLKHGQTVKIEGLPVGIMYTVEEDTSAAGFRYVVSYENATGTITEENSDVSVKVYNSLSYELPATGRAGSTKYLFTGCIMILTALSVLTVKKLRLINGF